MVCRGVLPVGKRYKETQKDRTSVHRFAVSFWAAGLMGNLTIAESMFYDFPLFGTQGAPRGSAGSSARHRRRRPEASKTVELGF
jgi:hypothetical protein